MKHLYIIGNGFDIHHGIPSSYSNYKDWLEKRNPMVLSIINDYYGYCDDEWWWQFEHNLGEKDIREYAEYVAKENYPDFSTDDFRDRDYHASEIAADDETSNVVYSVRSTFREWILSLPAPDRKRKIHIEKRNSLFLTFNYTETLETLYHIPSNNILHIHGGGYDQHYIIGHGKSYSDFMKEASDSLPEPPDSLDMDQLDAWYSANNDGFVEQAVEITAQRLSEMRKPTDQIIFDNRDFFEKLGNTEVIHIYGFSFSDIDMPYLHKIITIVDMNRVKWEISYFSSHDKDMAFLYKQMVNIPDNRFSLIRLNDILVSNYLQLKLPFKYPE